MKKNMILFGAVLAFGIGCQKLLPPIPPAPKIIAPDERAALQTHSFKGNYDVVFSAMIAVLQDRGWRLETVDKSAGLIRATTAHKNESLGPDDERVMNLQSREATIKRHTDVTQKWARWQELVIHTEPWGASQVRQRIILSLRGTLPAMSYHEEQGGTWYRRGRDVLIHAPPEEQAVEVDDPEAYRDLFERIEKALRQRQSA